MSDVQVLETDEGQNLLVGAHMKTYGEFLKEQQVLLACVALHCPCVAPARCVPRGRLGSRDEHSRCGGICKWGLSMWGLSVKQIPSGGGVGGRDA